MLDNTICSTKKLSRRWEKEMDDGSVRYYTAVVTRDLFDMIVLTRWGTVGTKRGGQKSQPVDSLCDAKKIIADVEKRRVQHGYVMVF